jgi:diguanylate cyclase (GGDEF)-like protein/PAS domain S-box-containing protein
MTVEAFLNAVAAGNIVLLFASLLKSKLDGPLKFWFLGWLSIFMHFVAALLPSGHSPKLNFVIEVLFLGTLVLAGIAFLIANTSLYADRNRTRGLAAALGIPSLLYALATCVPNSPRLPLIALIVISLSATAGIVWNHYRTWSPYVVTLIAGLVLIGMVLLRFTWTGQIAAGLFTILSSLYFCNAFVYWRRFPRLSTGVGLSVLGLLLWAAVFPVGAFSIHHGFNVPDVVWNLPKLFVALGMLFTVHEEDAARNRLIYDRSMCGLFRAKCSGELLDCNEAFFRMLCYPTREELVKGSHTSALPELRFLTTICERLQQSGHISHEEFVLQARDGSNRTVIVNATLMPDVAGTMSDIEGAVLDISEKKWAEQAVHESERRYRLVFEDNPQPMWIEDSHSLRILEVNVAAVQKYGYSREEFLRLKMTEIIHEQDRDELVAQAMQVQRLPVSGPWRHITKDGVVFWVELQVHAITSDGKHASIVMARDISERLASEAALRESERQQRELIEEAPIGIYRTTPDGKVLLANPALLRLFGYGSFEELATTDLEQECLPSYPRAKFRSELEKHGHLSDWQNVVHQRDGSMLVIREHARVIRDSNNQVLYYEGFIEDFTEQRKLHQQLIDQAHHDPLTGLPNRIALDNRLKEAASRARRSGRTVAILALDLDHFKSINDSLGHHAGDVFLAELSHRARTVIRSTDTLARVGGDEFVAVIEDLGPEGAERVARKILSHLSSPVQIEGKTIEASGSIGIAVFPDDGEDLDLLRRRADLALYAAKLQGRNQFCRYSPDMEVRLGRTSEMETLLRQAVNEGWFEVFYQPIYKSNTSNVLGFEALLRLNHPAEGLISPGEFIGVAESSGLIVPIENWVLRRACEDLRLLQIHFGESLTMSVNVSSLQFARDQYATTVQEILAATGVRPECLELELTETLVMSNVKTSAHRMQKLKDLGLRIAVDDFGTGYSSLSHLYQLPIDTLKLDRSFIEELITPSGTRPIVSAIIALAKTLGMSTVAEGIETREQLSVVTELGYERVQGNLVGAPNRLIDVYKLLGISWPETYNKSSHQKTGQGSISIVKIPPALLAKSTGA